MVCENLPIGRPALRYLRDDTKALLEANIHRLDGADCNLPDQPPTKMSKLGRIIIALIHKQCNEKYALRPTVLGSTTIWSTLRKTSFPAPPLLNSIDVDQDTDIC